MYHIAMIFPVQAAVHHLPRPRSRAQTLSLTLARNAARYIFSHHFHLGVNIAGNVYGMEYQARQL